jgi:RNA polymerase sigma-70 factor (ECF subfamily)
MLLLYLAEIEDHSYDSDFENLYNKYNKAFLGFAIGYIKDEREAMQAVDEAFFAIAKNIKEIAAMEEERQKVYVYTILKHKCYAALDELRKHNSYVPYEKIPSISDCVDLEVEMEEKELYRRAVEVIEKMPENVRDAFTLKFVYGHKAVAIAKIMDKPESSVRLWLKKGRDMLNKVMKEEKFI